jgi:hypothetical protein
LDNILKEVVEQAEGQYKEWIGLIEQWVCSSLDSGDSWEVDYLNEGSFKFTGELIILPETTNEKFVENKKNNYLIRDYFVA